MSLESALARVSQIQSYFNAGAIPPSTATTSTAASSAPSTAAQTNFATLLQGATAPSVANSIFGSGQATATAPTAAAAQVTVPGQVATAAPTTPITGATGAGAEIVNIAQSQVGQHEVPMGSNDGPAIAMYRTATQGAMAGEPWCAYFVSWAARQAGEPLGPQGQGYGYVGDIWNWAQQTGRAIPNGPGVVPQPGDLILFGTEHVGIVKQVLPNGSIETIEGNYGNAVQNVIRGAGEATGYVRM